MNIYFLFLMGTFLEVHSCDYNQKKCPTNFFWSPVSHGAGLGRNYRYATHPPPPPVGPRYLRDWLHGQNVTKSQNWCVPCGPLFKPGSATAYVAGVFLRHWPNWTSSQLIKLQFHTAGLSAAMRTLCSLNALKSNILFTCSNQYLNSGSMK